MFTAYNKIKSDLIELPVEINTNFIKYYQTNFQGNHFYADKIYQVDIKSCYASILRNNSIISLETFDFLQTINKQNRLAAVGMLAGKKNIFRFDNKGKCIYHAEQKNPYSDYFFFCVQETFRIMNDAKVILGDSYLFTWVDAIYLQGGEDAAKKVQEYFKNEHNLDSTFSELLEFEVELRRDYYRCRYIKEGEKTFMDIPTPQTEEKKEIMNYLLNKKYNNNENSKNSIRG